MDNTSTILGKTCICDNGNLTVIGIAVEIGVDYSYIVMRDARLITFNTSSPITSEELITAASEFVAFTGICSSMTPPVELMMIKNPTIVLTVVDTIRKFYASAAKNDMQSLRVNNTESLRKKVPGLAASSSSVTQMDTILGILK